MFWQPAEEELPQCTFHHGAQKTVALGEALIEDAEELLDVLADQPEQR